MSNEREKRARLSHACDRCRKRHVKCDGDYPICGNCKSVNGECSYSHPGSKRGYVETIDDRLSKIEQVLSRYLEGADSQQQSSHDSEKEPADSEVAATTTHDLVYTSTKKVETTTLVDSLSSLTLKNTAYLTIKHEHSDATELLEPPPPPRAEIQGPRDLPPKDLSDHLIKLYFKHGYSFRMPIIHKPSFEKQLKDKNNPPSLLLLNAIYAVGSLFSDDPRVRTVRDQPDTAGDVFFERARDLLDSFYDKPRLSSLQAVHLMAQFCVKSTRHSFRIWMLIGTQMRMAIDLGLHRDCYKWNLGKVEKALRNRLFWASYVAEIVSCASFGKPLPIYDYDTRLPYEIDEDGEDAQDVVAFMHLCKLLKILANILQSKPYFTQRVYLRNTLPAVEASLSSWLLGLPAHLQYTQPPTNDPDPAQVPPSTAFLHMMHNLVLIHLHRPYIHDTESFPHVDSQEVCTRAAIGITRLTACMPLYERATYVVYHCVAWCLAHAGMIHAMNVADPDITAPADHHMRRTLDWLKQFSQNSARYMGGVCGADNTRKMLEASYEAQKEQLEKNRAEREGNGGNNGYRRRGSGGSGEDKHSERRIDQLKTFPVSPASSTIQENMDGDATLSPMIVKAEQPPDMDDVKLSATAGDTSGPLSPALRQASSQQKARGLEHTRSQDRLRPRPARQQFTAMTTPNHLFKPGPTPEPSPQFPQQHLQYHHHGHNQQQAHLGDASLDAGQFMNPVVLSGVSLADPPIVPSSLNPSNNFTHGVDYGAVGGQDVGQVYLMNNWGMEISPSHTSGGQNQAVSTSNSPATANTPNGSPAMAGGQDPNAAFQLHQEQMAANFVQFPITSDSHPNTLLVGGTANEVLNGDGSGSDGHSTMPGVSSVARNNVSNHSSPGSNGAITNTVQPSHQPQQHQQQQQLLALHRHHPMQTVTQMPVDAQLHATTAVVNGQNQIWRNGHF